MLPDPPIGLRGKLLPDIRIGLTVGRRVDKGLDAVTSYLGSEHCEFFINLSFFCYCARLGRSIAAGVRKAEPTARYRSWTKTQAELAQYVMLRGRR